MRRLESLDSVRGIAALTVVMHHALLALAATSSVSWIYSTPLRLLFNGPAAVAIFFVLSGIVLSVSFIEKRSEPYVVFFLRRICRIWIPFVAAVFLSALLSHLTYIGPVSGSTGWFETMWTQKAYFQQVLSHVLMTGVDVSLDNPMWSLIIEMRISIIFPILVLFTLKNWRITLFFAIFVGIVCCKLIGLLYLRGWERSIISTFQYIPLFVLGIMISYRLKSLRMILGETSTVVKSTLWIAVALIFIFAPEDISNLAPVGRFIRTMILAGASGCLLMLCITEGRAMTILLGRIPLFLGKISYSLYLTHLIVIAFVVRSTIGFMSINLSVPLAVLLSIPVAWLSQFLIEAPAIRLGSWVSAKMRP